MEQNTQQPIRNQIRSLLDKFLGNKSSVLFGLALSFLAGSFVSLFSSIVTYFYLIGNMWLMIAGVLIWFLFLWVVWILLSRYKLIWRIVLTIVMIFVPTVIAQIASILRHYK